MDQNAPHELPVIEPTSDGNRRVLGRRQFLVGAAAFGLGAAAVKAGRRGSGAQNGESGKRTLRLLCWSGYDERALTAAFRQTHDVDIQADFLGANDEIFTFLRAGGLGEYDLVTPHNGVIQPLAAAGLIAPLDETLLTNRSDLFPRFQRPAWAVVDAAVYGVPVLWGTSPMVYAAAHLTEAPKQWIELQSSSRLRGRIVMTEDGIGQLMIWNGVMGYADPARVTISQLNATTDLLISIKRDRACAYVPSMNDVARLMAAGTAWVSTIGWEATPALPEAKGADLRLTHPKPGDYSLCDNLCLAANAPNPDLAHAFIDYLLGPEPQARLVNTLKRGAVNTKAVSLLEEPVRALYTYDDLDAVFALSPLRGFPPLQAGGDGIATYVDWVKSWERVRFTGLKTWPWTS